MTATDPAPSPTVDEVDPEAQAILDELAQLREHLDGIKRLQDAAQDKRAALWRRGLALKSPLTRVAMGSASGLSAEYITKALRPKPGQAPAKRARRRTTR